MASCFVLKIDGHEVDSGPKAVAGECADLFSPADRQVTTTGDEARFCYQISVARMIERLELSGFTLDNCREAIEILKDEMIAEVDMISEYVRTQPGGAEEIDLQREYLRSVDVEVLLEIFRRCTRAEHGFYPDLGVHDFSKNDLLLLDTVFQRRLDAWSEVPFHPFNTYRLLGEILPTTAELVLDYTDLVYAGYYSADDAPIEHGFDHQIAGLNPRSLIKGQRLADEEGLELEFKEVTTSSSVQAIRKNLTEYLIAFLNSKGGRVLWGVTNDRRVVGVRLSYENRDSLRQDLIASVDDVLPALAKDAVQLEFRPVVHDGQVLDDTFCVQLTAPRGEDRQMYFTRSGRTWVRLDGVTKELKGYDLYAHIARKGHRDESL